MKDDIEGTIYYQGERVAFHHRCNEVKWNEKDRYTLKKGLKKVSRSLNAPDTDFVQCYSWNPENATRKEQTIAEFKEKIRRAGMFGNLNF